MWCHAMCLLELPGLTKLSASVRLQIGGICCPCTWHDDQRADGRTGGRAGGCCLATVAVDDFILWPRTMRKRHRWVGGIADAEGYVRLSAAAASGGWERWRRAAKAAGGGGAGDYGVAMVKDGVLVPM